METIAQMADEEVYVLKVGVGEHGVKARVLNVTLKTLGPVMWLGSILTHLLGPVVETDEPSADDLLKAVETQDDADYTA